MKFIHCRMTSCLIYDCWSQQTPRHRLVKWSCVSCVWWDAEITGRWNVLVCHVSHETLRSQVGEMILCVVRLMRHRDHRSVKWLCVSCVWWDAEITGRWYDLVCHVSRETRWSQVDGSSLKWACFISSGNHRNEYFQKLKQNIIISRRQSSHSELCADVAGLMMKQGSKWDGIRRYGIPALIWSAWNHTATSFWPTAIPVCRMPLNSCKIYYVQCSLSVHEIWSVDCQENH